MAPSLAKSVDISTPGSSLSQTLNGPNRTLMAQPYLTHRIAMQPAGSLNRLPVRPERLESDDPLARSADLKGSDLVSRAALLSLLEACHHDCRGQLRTFLDQFDIQNRDDALIFRLFSSRFAAVINTARSDRAWSEPSAFSQALKSHWQSITTLVLSGGLTSANFGIHLAEQTEQLCPGLDVICSPWGGTTALFGLAQTSALAEDILVMDFGSTAIKRAIAHTFGNRLTMLPELKAADYCQRGLMRRDGLLAILGDTWQLIEQRPLPVAISIACYLDQGHPFDYHSGIYHRLAEDSQHLALDLNQHWLPQSGLGRLKLLEHDSTAAALAFQFNGPAMMITLGTGLGSAPCPSIKP